MSDAADPPPAAVNSANGQSRGGRLAVWLATGLGVGLVSPAPGTVGGLWGLPLAWGITQISMPGGQLAAIVVVSLLGVAICTAAARALGGWKDPQAIVLDEIASVPIVFFALPIDCPMVWGVGYVLLRIFDISKPPPIKWLERLPAGWGIMADDWMAGIYAALALRGVLWIDAAWDIGILTAAG